MPEEIIDETPVVKSTPTVAELDTEILSRLSTLESIKITIEDKQTKLGDTMTALNRENLTLEEKGKKIEGLESEISVLEAKLIETKSNAEFAQTSYNQKVAEINKNVEELEASRQPLLDEVKVIEENLLKLKVDNQIATAEHNQLMEEYRDEKARTLSALAKSKGDLVTVQSNIENASEDLAKLEREIYRLNNEIKALENTVTEKNDVIAKIDSDVQEKKSELADCLIAIEVKKGEITSLTNETAVAKTLYEEAVKESDAIRIILASQTDERDQFVKDKFLLAEAKALLDNREAFLRAHYERAGIKYE